MSMSGKTFLAAFQVGSRLLPDEVDRRINRGKINLQKELLELEKDVEIAKKEREKTDHVEEIVKSTGLSLDNIVSRLVKFIFPDFCSLLIYGPVNAVCVKKTRKSAAKRVQDQCKDNYSSRSGSFSQG